MIIEGSQSRNKMRISSPVAQYWLLTLLPTGGGGGGLLVRAIRLAVRTLEPFHLESPKFLNYLLCLLNTLWRDVRQINLGSLLSFFENEVMKNEGYEHFNFF